MQNDKHNGVRWHAHHIILRNPNLKLRIFTKSSIRFQFISSIYYLKSISRLLEMWLCKDFARIIGPNFAKNWRLNFTKIWGLIFQKLNTKFVNKITKLFRNRSSLCNPNTTHGELHKYRSWAQWCGDSKSWSRFWL